MARLIFAIILMVAGILILGYIAIFFIFALIDGIKRER